MNAEKALRLYLITDDIGRTSHDLLAVVEQAIEGGITAVQFREKSATPAHFEKTYAAIARLCRACSIPLLLNADLLRELNGSDDFDGIQYGSRSLPAEGACRGAFSGYSAHSLSEARLALSRGLAFVTYSPVFAPLSKRHPLPPLQLSGLAHACESLAGFPVVALGGVRAENARDCIAAGAKGVAVIGAIMQSENPKQAAQALRQKVDSALNEL